MMKSFLSLFKTGVLVIASLLAVHACASSPMLPVTLSPQSNSGQIQILDSYVLGFPNFEGVSDLAWDKKSKLLYAVTDKGWLFHAKVFFLGDKIQSIDILNRYPLRDANNVALKGKMADSEGMDLVYSESGEPELLISFERFPRIVRYSTQGKLLEQVKLPKKISHIAQYRDENKALESVVVHPDYGVMTATELPIKIYPEKQQQLYSLGGKQWSFEAANAENSAVTALELTADNDILVLERAWAGFTQPLVITLKAIDLEQCPNGKCSSKVLASLSTADDWMLDNFEGLTQISDDHYLMISDNNARSIQNTILVYFRISSIP